MVSKKGNILPIFDKNYSIQLVSFYFKFLIQFLYEKCLSISHEYIDDENYSTIVYVIDGTHTQTTLFSNKKAANKEKKHTYWSYKLKKYSFNTWQYV